MNRVADHLKKDLATISSQGEGQIDYYKTRKMVFDWLGKRGERKFLHPHNRSEALYCYRQALKFGDLEAAEKYLKKFFETGGTDGYCKNKMKLAHPLASIKIDQRHDFRKSLDPREDEVLKEAIDWYKREVL